MVPNSAGVPLVVGVGDEGDARPGSSSGRVVSMCTTASLPAGPWKATRWKCAGVVARLELGLGHRGLERDVPQARRLRLVGLAAAQVAQERLLRRRPRAVVDGAVVDVPVDREPGRPEDLLEGLLVLDGEDVAQLDEVAPADRLLVGGLDALAVAALMRRLVALVVVQGGVAAHAVVVLHAALGGQAVVVPAHRVEHLEAGHPLVAGDAVGLGVGEDVADVQRAAGGRRRGVDRVDLLAAAASGRSV